MATALPGLESRTIILSGNYTTGNLYSCPSGRYAVVNISKLLGAGTFNINAITYSVNGTLVGSIPLYESSAVGHGQIQSGPVEVYMAQNQNIDVNTGGGGNISLVAVIREFIAIP